MKPTKIVFRKLQSPKGKTLSFVDITFDDVMVIKDFRIVNGDNGLFLGNPSAPDKTGKYWDKVFILGASEKGTPGREFSNKLQAAVLKVWGESSERPAFEDQTTGGQASQSGFKGDKVPF